VGDMVTVAVLAAVWWGPFVGLWWLWYRDRLCPDAPRRLGGRVAGLHAWAVYAAERSPGHSAWSLEWRCQHCRATRETGLHSEPELVRRGIRPWEWDGLSWYRWAPDEEAA